MDDMKKNILYLTTDSSIGGAEKIVLAIAANIDKSKYNPIICTLKKKGSCISRQINMG